MTRDKLVHFLCGEPTGSIYRSLIDLSVSLCKTFLLVVRDMPLSPSGAEVLKSFEVFLQQETRGAKWPGTELFGGVTAMVHTYRLCIESARILTEAVDGLYSWQQPERPEDLWLLRQDGTPWLASIAHEAEGYFELTATEKDHLLAYLPGLGPLVVERE